MKRLREAQGLDRPALAKRMGLRAQSSVADIELDRRDIRVSKLLKVAKALKVSIEEILVDVDASYELYRRRDPVSHSLRVQTAHVTETRVFQSEMERIQAGLSDASDRLARLAGPPTGAQTKTKPAGGTQAGRRDRDRAARR